MFKKEQDFHSKSQYLTSPLKIEAYVPESKLYTELCELEKNLDAAIMRKRLDVQEALGKPTKVRRTLRIFVSNTAADQNTEIDELNNFEVNTENAPSWTLKIEGRLLDVSHLDCCNLMETYLHSNTLEI